jgi:hypothetical protein
MAPTWLGLEPLIIARLEPVSVPLNAAVLSVADLAGVLERDLPKPSVRVVYGGHQIVRDDKPLPPGWALIEQTWIVVPAVRNVRDIRSGAAGRADASPLIDAAFDALDGWAPGGGYSPLKSITPGLRPATVEGCTFVPLAFTSRFRRSQTCPT